MTSPKPKPIKKTITIRGVTYWRSSRELEAAEKRRKRRQK